MISVIIPIYILDKELEKLTHKCIDSLYEFATEPFELIVIDNASPVKMDIKCDYLKRNKENKGNAVGWNQGLEIANGDYLMLSDNDCLYGENWQSLAEHTDNAIVFPLTKCKGEDDWRRRLAGFSWIMDRKTYKKLGNISEDYGIANFEDTDYYMRAMKEGVDLKCVDDVKVLHYGRATCDKVPEVAEIYDRNKKLYESKYNKYPHLTI